MVRATGDALHPDEPADRHHGDPSTFPFDQHARAPYVLEAGRRDDQIERQQVGAFRLGDTQDAALEGAVGVEHHRVGGEVESRQRDGADRSRLVLCTNQQIDVAREAGRAVNRDRDAPADGEVDPGSLEDVDHALGLRLEVQAHRA
jgi:hypothetical protein